MLTAERERLRAAAVQIMSTLAGGYRQNGDTENAISTLRRLLALEPWREEDHFQLMDLLAASGEYHAALRQYELCRMALAHELDVEPGEDITRLYTRLKANPNAAGPRESPAALPVVHAAAGSAQLKTAPPHNLPQPSTAFVGRAAEIQALVTRLQDPACRS